MLDPELQRKLEELFQIAVTVPGVELPAFFARHCGDDDELRAELESLLEHDEETREYLRSPVDPSPVEATPGTDLADETTQFLRHSIPERVGRYHVLDKLGAGGMGAVYLAEQRRPVRRRVALKIVRAEMDGAQVLERFEHERQTLAMMDHPGIASILDAGTTGSGRPFFVMEFVPGTSITRYCDEHRLALAERLALLARVCDAVQHAHQKGIVHRDIKPSNVIVSVRDGVPEPRIIDFGIACAVGRRRPRPGEDPSGPALLGTLHYMAPEQADPSNLDVDTRADVYSLGVLAYELLVGVLPLRATELRDRPAAELARAVAQMEPPAPSARAGALAPDRAEELAALRRLGRRRWIRSLAGDLDAVVGRAMQKDRVKRYASASELGADVRRYLALEPISAGRSTFAGSVSRYVRRHRVGVVSGAVVAVALVTAIVALAWGTLEARATERRARAAEARLDGVLAESRAARALAESQRERSAAVLDFLRETVALAGRETGPVPQRLLERAGERVGELLADDPAAEAELRQALGESFHALGELELAERHLRRALLLRERMLSTPLAPLYRTSRLLGMVQAETNLRDAAPMRRRACLEAVDLVERADPALADELGALVVDELPARDPAPALRRLAQICEAVGRRAGAPASPGAREVLAAADVLDHAGAELGERRGLRAGVAFLDAALALRQARLDPADLELAGTRSRLAGLLADLGEHARAEPVARTAAEHYARRFGAAHFRALLATSRRGTALAGLGRADEARRLLVESHAALEALQGSLAPAAAEAAARLVAFLAHHGPAAHAAELRRELARSLAWGRNAPARWSLRRAAFGPEHAELAAVLDRYVALDARPGEPAERAACAAALELRRGLMPDEEPLALLTARVLRDALPAGGGVPAGSRAEIAGELVALLGPRGRELPELEAESRLVLARACEDGEARAEHLRRGLAVLRDSLGPIDRLTLYLESRLARCLAEQGRSSSIEHSLVTTWLACSRELGLSHENTALALTTLRDLYDSMGTPGALAEYLRPHLAGRIEADVNPARLRTWTWYAVRADAFDGEILELADRASRRADRLAGVPSWHHPAVLHRLGRTDEAAAALARISEGDAPRELAFRALVAAARGQVGEARRVHDRLERLLDADARVDLAPLLDELRRALALPADRGPL